MGVELGVRARGIDGYWLLVIGRLEVRWIECDGLGYETKGDDDFEMAANAVVQKPKLRDC